MRKVIALILGGGQGKRLFPLTKYRSKPAVPIGGKYRIIDIPVSNCLHSGIKDIYVITQFNSESLNNHINSTYRFDYFSRAFVRILAAEQTLDNTNWFQGTADAVRRSLPHVNLHEAELILILSGDCLYRMDYRHLVDFHIQKGSDFTISVIPVKANQTREFGILRLNKNHRITDFKEKPYMSGELKPFRSSGNRYPASMGVYLFKVDTLKKVLQSKDADFGREVIPNSIGRFKACGYVFDDYWRDIGNIRSFYDVNIDFTSRHPRFSFFSEDRVFTRPRFLPPAQMANSVIKNSLITEGCIIDSARIEHSVVGLRSIIGEGCRMRKTVMMGADYYEDRDSLRGAPVGVGDGCDIEKAIIDKNARIGKNVIIKNLIRLKDFDSENYYIRDGIVIIPKNAVIPDNTRI